MFFEYLLKKSSVYSICLIIVKEKSITADSFLMNLHEECLIKYLINPLDLFYATELLKNTNRIIEENLLKREFIAKKPSVNYTVI